MNSPKSPKPKGDGKAGKRYCVFCEEGDICEEMYGKLLSKGGVTAHYFCMLFASGLGQNGKSEKQGVLGFLPEDILREVKRGTRLRCSYCRKVGATIGCVIRNCKRMFHLGCGRRNDTLHEFYGTFSSFCPGHRRQQDVPSDDDPSIVCSICMNTVVAAPSNQTIRAPCCRKYWYHRECVQRYASSAGLYFFKCPLCNNKDDFQNEMLLMGIYIPDQDASWEKEPHAFQELLERYGNCDAPVCKCAEGRKYDKEGSKWEIILCDFCGSHGSHVACSHLEKFGKHNICKDCKEVDERTREEEWLRSPPSGKRKSLEQLQLELSSSPETSKGSSPYPGPSKTMVKKGLPQPRRSLMQSQKQREKPKEKESQLEKRSYKRQTNIESGSSKPKKLRRNSAASATVTSSWQKQSKNSLISPNSSFSDESSGDDISLNMLRKRESFELESAWDVRKRKREELKRKQEIKKQGQISVDTPVIAGEADSSESNSGMKVAVGKLVRRSGRKSVSSSHVSTESALSLEIPSLIENKRNDIGGTSDIKNEVDGDSVLKEKSVEHPELQMESKNGQKVEHHTGGQTVEQHTVKTDQKSPGADQSKKGKRKKRSLEADKNQPTLTGWLLQGSKNQNSSKEEKSGHNSETEPNVNKTLDVKFSRSDNFAAAVTLQASGQSPLKQPENEDLPVNDGIKNARKSHDKKCVVESRSIQQAKNSPAKSQARKPLVIEWQGRQLQIKSPRVLLRRNSHKKQGLLKPRNLEIDMLGTRGLEWSKDLDLLSNIETRVTRNMLEVGMVDCTRRKTPITNNWLTSESASDTRVSDGHVSKSSFETRVTRNMVEAGTVDCTKKKTPKTNNWLTCESASDSQVSDGHVGKSNEKADNEINTPEVNVKENKVSSKSEMKLIADRPVIEYMVYAERDQEGKTVTRAVKVNMEEKNSKLEKLEKGKRKSRRVSTIKMSTTPLNVETKQETVTSVDDHSVNDIGTDIGKTKELKILKQETNSASENELYNTNITDSPAKNLRTRLKKDNFTEGTKFDSSPVRKNKEESGDKALIVDMHVSTLEAENQLTPTAKQNGCFHFSGYHGKSHSEEKGCHREDPVYVHESNKSSSERMKEAMDKLRSDMTKSEKNENERLNISKDNRVINLLDSPARNLRNRLGQKLLSNGKSGEVCSLPEQSNSNATNNDNSKSNTIERLKKYKPKFMGSLLKNALPSGQEASHSDDTNKIDAGSVLKDATRHKENEKFDKFAASSKSETLGAPKTVLWHCEGTKQIHQPVSPHFASIRGSVNCENKCPESDLVSPSACNVREISPRRATLRARTLNFPESLAEKLNELTSHMPLTVAEMEQKTDYSGIVNLSSFTKFKRTSSRLGNFTFSLANGPVICSEQNSVVENGNANQLSGSNMPVGAAKTSNERLRSSPRKPGPGTQASQTCDRLLMAEYYGTENQRQNGTEHSSTVLSDSDSDNDVVELPLLLTSTF